MKRVQDPAAARGRRRCSRPGPQPARLWPPALRAPRRSLLRPDPAHQPRIVRWRGDRHRGAPRP